VGAPGGAARLRQRAACEKVGFRFCIAQRLGEGARMCLALWSTVVSRHRVGGSKLDAMQREICSEPAGVVFLPIVFDGAGADLGTRAAKRAGDGLAQRGTIHNWINNGTAPCVIAFALIDAKPATAGGKVLTALG
jgi:hypothetical protein